MSSTSPAASAPKQIRGMGPAIIVVLIICAALLGFYQYSYYPSVAKNSSSSITLTPPTPHIANITILVNAGGTGTPRALTYSPDVATVYLGYNSTIVWTNADSAEHTITGNSSDQNIDPNFYTWSLQGPQGFNNIFPKGDPGDSLNFTFTVAGTYGYFCKYHSNMVGTIIVKPANANLTETTSSKSSTLVSTSASSLGGLDLPYLMSAETVFAMSLATLTGSGTAP